MEICVICVPEFGVGIRLFESGQLSGGGEGAGAEPAVVEAGADGPAMVGGSVPEYARFRSSNR